MNRKRTAVFGGSFDPVHVGHISLARAVLENGMAEEVWLLVSPQNPLKQGLRLSDEVHRLNMVRLAVAGCEGLVASDFEFSLPRPSYTVNTLEALEATFPDREFLLLIGADNWAKFPQWYKADEIVSRYGIIVYPRGNVQALQLPANVRWLPAELYDVSSTEVRAAVAQGTAIGEYVHPEVEKYIKDNGLYA